MALDGHKASGNLFLFTFPMSSRVCALLMAGEHMVGITDASGNTMLNAAYVPLGQMRLTTSVMAHLAFCYIDDSQLNQLVIFTILGFIT